MKVITIGLDVAKSVFQVHGVDWAGAVVVQRKLKRAQLLAFFKGLEPCVVGLEACGSAHHWARALAGLGHEVGMLSARDVKAYVRRNKTDAADAAAICEAASRPHLRRVPVKTVERQAVLSMHKARALLIGQRTRTTNALRGHLAEYGVVEPPGVRGLEALLARLAAGELGEAPGFLATALQALAATLEGLQTAIRRIERAILDWHRQDRESRRLADAPGFGPLVSSAVRAHLGEPPRR